MRMCFNCVAKALVAIVVTAASPGSLMAQQPSAGSTVAALLPDAPKPQPFESEGKTGSVEGPAVASVSDGVTLGSAAAGKIGGTVTDTNGDLVPGVVVMLDGPHPEDHREVVANDNAAFLFDALKPGIPYRVHIKIKSFSEWTSSDIILVPGQNEFLTGIQLKVEGEQTSVTAYASTEQLAAEQVQLAEQQRVLGFIPNFYVVYDSKNAVPLTTKLKFKLALRVSVDPVTIGGVAFMAGINQAANRPDYVQGAKGYGQRFGAIAADGSTDILLGGAILPSLLHQDPRYFYQGTGTTSSRLKHAMFSPFVCRGDNGRAQINFSSLGGNLAASALSNAYYPQSNRGVGLVFGTFAIGTAERMVSGIAQEFILPRLTPKAAKSAGHDRDQQ